MGCELDVKIEIPEGSTEEEKIRIAKAYIKAWNDMSRDGSVDWHRASGEKIIKRAAEKILVGVKVLLSMPKD